MDLVDLESSLFRGYHHPVVSRAERAVSARIPACALAPGRADNASWNPGSGGVIGGIRQTTSRGGSPGRDVPASEHDDLQPDRIPATTGAASTTDATATTAAAAAAATTTTNAAATVPDATTTAAIDRSPGTSGIDGAIGADAGRCAAGGLEQHAHY